MSTGDSVSTKKDADKMSVTEKGVDRCPTLTAEGDQNKRQLEGQPGPHDVSLSRTEPLSGTRAAWDTPCLGHDRLGQAPVSDTLSYGHSMSGTRSVGALSRTHTGGEQGRCSYPWPWRGEGLL